jgi:hypothetical protein
MVEEREHGIGGEVLKIERYDGTLVANREESQEELEGVTVAAYRVRAHSADPGEVIRKETA